MKELPSFAWIDTVLILVPFIALIAIFGLRDDHQANCKQPKHAQEAHK